jgi:hypothetical protein
MGVILENFQSQRGRPPKHDWDRLTDGKARRLYRGVDFDAQLPSFRTMVHRKARDLGLRAHTSINEADASIVVEFYVG